MKRFQKVATEFAHHKGYDGVICGHIHQAALDESEQGIYGNCGDWIESCTFLVENKEGNIELMHWADQKLRLSLCQTEICSGSSLIEESPNEAA